MSIRASIPLELYAVIDAALKTLKISSRRVTAVEEAFAEEAQVLKRIYYKSKNQHRSALFFKRTQEVRRMSERVSSTRISKPLAAIRDGFHDLTPAEFTKVYASLAPRLFYVLPYSLIADIKIRPGRKCLRESCF